MAQIKQTTLLVNLDAVAHNYRFIRSLLQKDTRLLGVVKASGYGSSMVDVARELEDQGIDYFAVAYVSEGVSLRDAGITTPILVLHPLPVNFQTLIDRCLEPSIYSINVLRQFIEVAEGAGQKDYPIHLKLNTGLNRLGLSPEADVRALELLSQTSSVKVRSLLSHLAASEDPSEKEFSLEQIAQFRSRSDEFIKQLGYRPLLHTLNSSGIFNYPEAQFDMVRSGIGLYGYGNDPRFSDNLRPVSQLVTVISQIHDLGPGETVGYNRGHTAIEPMRTATLPMGHADGLSRAYGKGKGWVNINGIKAPIIGNVCMDMLMVDVTGIKCKEGDTVTVFGDSPTAEEVSEAAGTIAYELLTAVSPRVKRRVVRDVNLNSL